MGGGAGESASGRLMPISIIKDLRGHFGPARDQDPRPTCMAFAGSDAHAGARPGWNPLSVEWAYYHALLRDGSKPHEGLSLAAMLATLENDGQPVEVEWPYIASLFADFASYRPPIVGSAIFKRKSKVLSATIDEILAYLGADRPVLFLMSISPLFYSVPSSGIVSGTEPIQRNRIHALVAVGHGTNSGKRLVLVRNSWGEGWGLNGHAWLDEEYLKPRLLGAAAMAEEI